MLNKNLMVAAMMAWAAWSPGAVLTQQYDVDALLPDGNPIGYHNTEIVSVQVGHITDVNVILNIAGGWNGDLYATLTHDGQTAVLLNRPGKTAANFWGYYNAGMDVLLNDQAAADIHTYGAGDITGGAAWQPDGRANALDTQRDMMLDVFNNLDPNGSWTLFVADLKMGGVARLTSWSLQISAIPEPIHVALVIFGLLFGANALRHRRRAK